MGDGQQRSKGCRGLFNQPPPPSPHFQTQSRTLEFDRDWWRCTSWILRGNTFFVICLFSCHRYVARCRWLYCFFDAWYKLIPESHLLWTHLGPHCHVKTYSQIFLSVSCVLGPNCPYQRWIVWISSKHWENKKQSNPFNQSYRIWVYANTDFNWIKLENVSRFSAFRRMCIVSFSNWTYSSLLRTGLTEKILFVIIWSLYLCTVSSKLPFFFYFFQRPNLEDLVLKALLKLRLIICFQLNLIGLRHPESKWCQQL